MNGEALLLDACGAVFAPAHSALIFADLHFEKGSFYARRRQFLPPYDTADTLGRMARAIARHSPARVIALGDSFHDPDAGDRLGREARSLLESLTRSARFTWITGNHDPKPPAWLEGEVTQSLRLGGLMLRHEPRAIFEPGEVAGHLHPCASVTKWGRGVRRRCFVSDGLRLILPSFGAYTGGLDVGDDAITALFTGSFHAYMLGHKRVYAIPRHVAV
ncbi:MAG TPA: ligase-associated DNA damage response endonuclease PdeM [Rhizomicrobium sp.]|nr:ligase-associated DNA damage response endonuclease PdeM [Rhizomicrobium sp.]